MSAISDTEYSEKTGKMGIILSARHSKYWIIGKCRKRHVLGAILILRKEVL